MAPHGNADLDLAVPLLADASARVVRTVDGFEDGDWAAPSLLPGWTRAHVVAHLVLNAEAISAALRSLVADDEADTDAEPRPMYASDEARDADIAELAGADPAELRDRLMAGTTILEESIAAVTDSAWETRLERTPGGRRIRAAAFPGMRLRELEIHHVDLDAGYTPSAWSQEFAEHLLDSMVKRLSSPVVEIRPSDSPRTWLVGSGEAEYPVPVVTGPAGDAGWWLTGRPAPDTLQCSQGELPSIEGW